MTKFALALVVSMLGATLWIAPPARAQSHRPHAEACTHQGWGFLWATNYNFGTINRCEYSVEVWIMTSSGGQAHAQVPAGGVFDSGFASDKFDTRQWMAAICPAGYKPDIEFSVTNAPTIQSSHYTCIDETL